MDGWTGTLIGAAPGEHLGASFRRSQTAVETAGLFLVGGLRNGEDARVVAAPAHLEGIRTHLGHFGVDVAKLRRGGRYQELDAAAIADDLLSRDLPPTESELRRWILAVLGPDRGRPIRVYGEVVSLLAAGGQPDLALQLESAWNRVVGDRPVALLCGYLASAFPGGASSEFHRHVAAAHVCMPAL